MGLFGCGLPIGKHVAERSLLFCRFFPICCASAFWDQNYGCLIWQRHCKVFSYIQERSRRGICLDRRCLPARAEQSISQCLQKSKLERSPLDHGSAKRLRQAVPIICSYETRAFTSCFSLRETSVFSRVLSRITSLSNG